MTPFTIKRFFKRVLGVITFRKWRMNTLYFWYVKRMNKHLKAHDTFYVPIYQNINYRGPLYYVFKYYRRAVYHTLRLIGKISK